MTVPTASEFLLRFPEFGEQSLSVVEAALADAAVQTPEAIWGVLQAQAVSYLAAHLLGSRIMQIGNQVGATAGAPVGEGLKATQYGQSYVALRDTLPLSGFAL